MSDNDFIWRFTPSRTDPELLEAIFVQREPLLVDLLERVAESATTASKHHVLLIGPRGFGKTHLITLLNHRLSKDATMSDRIRVAWLLEDETITSFVQLLKRIYEVLAQQYPTEFPLDWLQDLLTESPKQIRQQLEAKMVESFASRTMLLCIENLDFLFSGLGTSGQHDWRAFLQEHPFTTIIASTQRLFADVKSREKPFFGFFSPVPLEPLSVNDAVELLRRVAKHQNAVDLVAYLDSAEGRSRVRALHHLAGGNHRIYVVLSGFITRESLDELVGPFQKMADDLTPYYQERLRSLSPQQRQIVEYLCSQDRPCIPKQIARQLLATENTISSQLKKLLDLGYVLRSERGRESLYELGEPLMRLASEVKEQQRRPLQMLVNFLRVWYRPDVLPELMKRAGTDSLRRYIAAAIEASQTTPDPRIQIIDAALVRSREENREDELIQALEEKAQTTNSVLDWYEVAYALSALRHDHEYANEIYSHCLKRLPENVDLWNAKGVQLMCLMRYTEALGCFDKAIGLNRKDALPWANRGNVLGELKRHKEAFYCFEKAIEVDPNDAALWNDKGYLLRRLKRQKEAVECFLKAIELDSMLVQAWRNLTEALMGMNDWNEALTQLQSALEKFGHSGGADVSSKMELLRCHFGTDGEETVEKFAQLYVEFGAVMQLGGGLIRSLEMIDMETATPASLQKWRDFWIAWGTPHSVMQVPLRLFGIGVEYLIKKDPKVLLDLVLSERQILGQVLGIDVS